MKSRWMIVIEGMDDRTPQMHLASLGKEFVRVLQMTHGFGVTDAKLMMVGNDGDLMPEGSREGPTLLVVSESTPGVIFGSLDYAKTLRDLNEDEDDDVPRLLRG